MAEPCLPGSDPKSHAAARHHLEQILIAAGSKPALARRLREALEERYRERGRHYHDLNHIAALHSLATTHRTTLADPDAVTLGIWYHDAVYRSRRVDNEEASAALARLELGPLLPAPSVERVAALILATRTHQAVEGLPDSGVFLDFDLAILAADAAVYDLYRKAIRAEYRWVPGFLYRRKRAEVLRRFLDRPAIYFTEPLRVRWEEPARANLARELAMLER